MPAATPLPRGPLFLTLYSADELLIAPGCPVCRYAGEASDRYVGWFALEGHAQPAMITSLCASLGLCAPHTRRLMSQPGAAVRLTAVYRYVLTAARDRLAGRRPPVTSCPACEHDHAAADRALETLLEGLADGMAMDACRDLGGLCIPHLGASVGHGKRRIIAWLVETMQQTLASHQVGPDWLAGSDNDAEVRAVLRQQVPAPGASAPGACPACLAAAQAERDRLAHLSALAGNSGHAAPEMSLCPEHLADAAGQASRSSSLRPLLVWQAESMAARLHSGRPAPRALGPLLAGRSQNRKSGCPVCRAGSFAAQRALSAVRDAVRTVPQASQDGEAICVRHLLILRKDDARAGEAIARGHVEAAGLLIRDLVDAFEQNTWTRRRGSDLDTSAYRRAAAFLDGRVFGGCPPRGNADQAG